MADTRLLLFAVLALTGLAYCIWKTQGDWQREGFGWRVVWGTAASVSAFLFLAFIFMASVLKRF